MREVAVVILNYNGFQYLQKFIPFLVKYGSSYDIVVADNNSSDNSIPFLNRNFPDIKIIKFDQNFGFCTGYNLAIRQIENTYCILLNSDIEVTENWSEPMIDLLKSDKSIGAVQPKLLTYAERDLFEYAGGAGGLIDRWGYPLCRGRLFRTFENDTGQYDDTSEIFWASGACMATRTETFLKNGGFDDSFFAHMEEIDFCWRLKNAGYKIMYTSESVIYHVGGGTLPKENPKKTFLNFRNSLLVLLKNLPSEQVVFKIFLRLILDFPAAILFLFQGNWRSSLMIFKAHIHFYLLMRATIKKRYSPQNQPENMKGCYRGSLLLKYYYTGVRKYVDL